MRTNKGFLLIEALLAIGILGGAVLFCLGLFTPVLSKVRDVKFMQEFEEVERRVNAFIQMGSFEEIYKASQREEIFYFYEDNEGRLYVSKSLSEINGNKKIIRAQIGMSLMKDTKGYEPEDYPESYFGLWVEIDQLADRTFERIEGKVRTFTAIKNR